MSSNPCMPTAVNGEDSPLEDAANNAAQSVHNLLAQSERIGVIGSPSSTAELALDILGTAVTRKLVGELALFEFEQDGSPHYALGQITEIELRNVWHEDPTIRSLIRQRGSVDAISARQDTHQGRLITSAVFRELKAGAYDASMLGTIPSTGTWILVVTDPVIEALLRRYREQIFYLGRVYGSQPKLPLWFKHFGTGADGAGEAYHLGVFGKTGSGKSALAKMMLTAYARYPQMGLLVIDPQGEIAGDMRRGTTNFGLPIRRLLQAQQKPYTLLSVQNLVLDRWSLFEEIIFESPFFRRFTISQSENRRTASSLVRQHLEGAVNLDALHERASFDAVWQYLQDPMAQMQIFQSPGPRSRLNAMFAQLNGDQIYNDNWAPVTHLFRSDRPNARTVDRALAWLLDAAVVGGVRNALIIDVSREGAQQGAQAHGNQQVFWNDRIQFMVIRRLLDGLTQTAERFYQQDRSLNTLVVIDEAQRLAPRGTIEEAAARRVRDTLIDAARTTRKYGLGWMFISQSLSSIDPQILQQLRIFFFGFGLGMGQEFETLKQLAGSSPSAMRLYQNFRDPQSAFDNASRQYSFMTVGPVSPLSFSDTPLFFTAFSAAEFLEANNFTPEGDRVPRELDEHEAVQMNP
jgi:hypothetical protein